MARRKLCGAAVRELGGRGQPAGMVDQRIAKADPQLRVAGIAPHGVLKDADRILALAVARERFGHAQPAFGGREIAEEGVARVGQRNGIAAGSFACAGAPGGRACPGSA